MSEIIEENHKAYKFHNLKKGYYEILFFESNVINRSLVERIVVETVLTTR
jgi:hypothetical protein